MCCGVQKDTQEFARSQNGADLFRQWESHVQKSQGHENMELLEKLRLAWFTQSKRYL